MYLTSDGGRTWTRQPGGANSLETLSGNVIRLVSQNGCPPGCTYRVELAPIGGTGWRTVQLPGSQGSGGPATLVRTGHTAAIEDYGNRAGGADARGVLWTSADDGADWTNRGEPCPQDNSVTPRPGIRTTEVDSAALAAAPDGSLIVLCVPRFRGHAFTITSTDGGRSFHAANRAALGSDPWLVAAASATDQFVDEDALYRSTDGGRTWSRAQQNSSNAPLRADWIGFETSHDGRVVTNGGRTIYTTHDGGRTWRPYTFP